MVKRHWSQLDIILITGDAYVDHPSYGAAVIGRFLEDKGFKVGIISQPDWKDTKDFTTFGRPRLFFGITSGNVDSMIANYTANKRPRKTDDYSPGSAPPLRPDRAVIVYANRAREAFPGVPVVLGGIEASLRRLAHYDYWDDCVRGSILLDSQASILVYGMGEKQVLEIAQRLDRGERADSLDGIRGTVVARKDIGFLKDCVRIPSFAEVKRDKGKFVQAFKALHANMDPFTAKTLVQEHDSRYVIQFPPQFPLSTGELDSIYELPYARDWHPAYGPRGGVKGFETVRFSIISHRGCCGQCSFCSLYMHHGRIIQSRSQQSILREAELLSRRKDFKGTITDVGGPTANLYRAHCRLWESKGGCPGKDCLMPRKCDNLMLGYRESLELYRNLRHLPGVKNVFIGSGFRYDLLTEPYADEYLEEICAFHISGQMKVAPEHSADRVLAAMNKPPFHCYEKFVRNFKKMSRKAGKDLFLVNYFLTSHPGSGLKDALELALYLAARRIRPQQVQDFIPSPLTMSACMYHAHVNPMTGEKVHVPQTLRERQMQRALVQCANPRNRELVVQALKELRATHVFRTGGII